MQIPNYEIEEVIHETDQRGVYLVKPHHGLGQYVVHTHDFSGDAEGAQQHVDQLTRVSQIRQRNLCEITDFGINDEVVFVVMPYYGGGTFNDLLPEGLTIQRLRSLIRAICDGLDALHRRGLFHGDLKPDNIVLDRSGTLRLIDGDYLAPKRGTIRYSPVYAPPEQALGHPLTAQCDIYALGVMVLQVLLGRMPWKASESEDFPARTPTDIVPPLSNQFVAFTQLIERMVAFDPQDRPASITQARSAFERLTIDDDLSATAIKSDLISTNEITAVLPPVPGSQSQRADGALSFDRRSLLSWCVVALVFVAGLWAITEALYRTSVVHGWFSTLGLVENPELVLARQNAEALVADPKQDLRSIVAAYEAVLVIVPDDADSLIAIENAKSRWLAEFEAALTKNELNVAQLYINDLLSIDPDDVTLLMHFDQLQIRRQAIRLTSDTVALMRVRAPDSDASLDMALHAFREVMRLYPASTEAANELNKLAGHFSDKAAREVDEGNIQQAIDSLGKAGLANPNFEGLAVVRDRIRQATTIQEEIANRLREAESLMMQERFIDPPADNAAELYHSVLTADPEHEAALKGLGDISASVVESFDEHLIARDFTSVRALIDRAKEVGLFPMSIMHMESSFADELTRIGEAADLIVLAESLIMEGYLTQPPDNNAVGVLEKASELDPLNDRISVLFNQCAERLANVAVDANRVGLTDVAESYMLQAEEVVDDPQRWQAFRDRIGLN